mmetsp:Transcript_34640/g.83102  ORF Transcript_34640/g.83102 Transcript_34640/m.83102 type:complete len:210 (+) Transcript_34640:7062-7691(+)
MTAALSQRGRTQLCRNQLVCDTRPKNSSGTISVSFSKPEGSPQKVCMRSLSPLDWHSRETLRVQSSANSSTIIEPQAICWVRFQATSSISCCRSGTRFGLRSLRTAEATPTCGIRGFRTAWVLFRFSKASITALTALSTGGSFTSKIQMSNKSPSKSDRSKELIISSSPGRKALVPTVAAGKLMSTASAILLAPRASASVPPNIWATQL